MRSPGFWRLWGYINATALIYLAAFCRCACERSPKCSSDIDKAVIRRKYYKGRAKTDSHRPSRICCAIWMLRIYRKSEHPIHEALKHELAHFMKTARIIKQFTEFAEKSEMFAKWLQRYGFNNIQDAQNQIIDSRETRGME